MAAQFVQILPDDLKRVRLKLQELKEDPRTANLGNAQLVALANRLVARRPLDGDRAIDAKKIARRERKERKSPPRTPPQMGFLQREGKDNEMKDDDDGWEYADGHGPEGWVEGEGVIGDAVRKVLKFFAPKAATAAVKKMFAKYGNMKSKSDLLFTRVPIVSIIEKFLRLTGAKIAPEHDKVMHDYLLTTMENGDVLIHERNQTVQIRIATEAEKKMIVHDLPDGVKGPAAIRVKGPGWTLNEMYAAGEKEAVKRNPELGLWRYASMSQGSTPSNNCQDFLLSMAAGMKVLTPALSKFIKQDIDNLLPGWANKLQQAVTDVAGAVGQHVLGKGSRRRLHIISDN